MDESSQTDYGDLGETWWRFDDDLAFLNPKTEVSGSIPSPDSSPALPCPGGSTG